MGERSLPETQLEDKRHFPKPGPFETYLGKAQEFVAGEMAFEVATIGGGSFPAGPESR